VALWWAESKSGALPAQRAQVLHACHNVRVQTFYDTRQTHISHDRQTAGCVLLWPIMAYLLFAQRFGQDMSTQRTCSAFASMHVVLTLTPLLA
jgi:hypothetical protein